jgi:hypothetical protein
MEQTEWPCYRAPVVTQEFKTLFCEAFNCPPAEYEERAFRMCLPWYARWLAPVFRKANADFFAEDFRFLRYLGAATDGREANAEVMAFQDTNRAKGSFLRIGLRIRVSGRIAAGLAQQLFPDAPRHRE